MGAKHGIFGLGFLYALAILEVDLRHRIVEANQLGQFLQIIVYLLIADNWKDGTSGENVLYF